jgi:GAF domain-containing protein
VDNRSAQRYTSLQRTITIGMVVLGVVISAIVTGTFYFSFSNQVREDIKLRLKNIADITAAQIKPGDLSTVVDKTDVDKELYIKYQKEFSDIIKTNNDVINIYTMRQDKAGKIYFYMDAGDSNYQPDPPGVTPYLEPSPLLLATFASPSGTAVENNIYTDEFGTVISAYVPLYNPDGSLESILGVDMRADAVIIAERKAIQQILIYFGISIPLIALLSWFLGHRFSRQSVALSSVATHIAQLSEGKLETIPISLAGNNKEAFELIQIFNKMSGEIQNLIQKLEQRVAERTHDLEEANTLSEKRARQFEAIIRISSTITSIQNLQELLPLISEVISQQFGFYHVGIFLSDASNQYAVLSAANSEGGKKMLKRVHQLKIGEQGIVGYVTGTGNPRVALDVGEDVVFFNNPDLPETHSEMALPLKITGKVIGALDVQSTEPNAFSTEDVKVLSALADQVSLAIQNARLFDQIEKTLAETDAVQRQYIRETWSQLPKEEKLLGYRYSIAGSIPLDDQTTTTLSEDAKDKQEINVPIILRGETIGTLSVRVPANNYTSVDQLDLIKAVAERVALSAENARLFEDTTRRATRESLVSDITNKIRSTNDPQEMISTAMKELQRALGATRVEIIPQNITPAPNK